MFQHDNVSVVIPWQLEPEERQYSARQLRAVGLLVPVLGLHYVLLPVRPAPGSVLEPVYDLLHTIASSYQGEGL